MQIKFYTHTQLKVGKTWKENSIFNKLAQFLPQVKLSK